MTLEELSVEAVARALGDDAVASVAIVEEFVASAARVARLRLGFADGRARLTVIGKSATGTGLPAARRERRFFERLAPRWASPAPRLLGACEHGRGDDARVLLLTEDLGAAGYALVRDGLSEAQLHGAVDTLVDLHARFWDQLPIAGLDFDAPAPAVTQSAQAWPPAVIAVHAAAAGRAVARFVDAAAAQITPSERALLDELVEAWEGRFLARVAGGRAVTLIHGDFHLLGNVLFAANDPRPRVIDWSEAKPGLGPHDLAYCLVGVPCDDRPARDHALVRRYWDGLRRAGIEGYAFEPCWWDYRFSICTNLFQAVFQDSVMWFRKTAAVVAALDCRAVLQDPPPRS